MRVASAISKGMGMSAGTWRRHANRWSVWTRLAMVPALALAVYARDWFGLWTLLWVALIVLWLWLNVRVFAPVHSDSTWEARAIFGEKIWLERKSGKVPAYHSRSIVRLNIASSLTVPPMAWGLWGLDSWATAFGVGGLLAGQLWVLDRCSWLLCRHDAGSRRGWTCQDDRWRLSACARDGATQVEAEGQQVRGKGWSDLS